jgi:hypothetical protein
LHNTGASGTTAGFARDDGIAIGAVGTGGTKDHPALHVSNQNTSTGMAAYLTNDSSYHTVHIDNKGTGGVLFLQNNGNDAGTGGEDFITAVSRGNDKQFRVASNGSVYNDTGLYTSPADFAEMLPAVEGLAAGDVLVIGAEGRLTRSEKPYQASVAGVHSTEPGFVGGYPMDGPEAGTIPLAMVGVVPVKVSAENGSIQPGDLLVTSSVAGHAMAAGPNPPQGTVLGKALEGWAVDQGTGVIKILVTLQ